MEKGKTRAAKNEHVLLGSGDFYLMDFAGTVPEDEVVEVAANMIGGIKGGATLTYSATLYTVMDDMRKFAETIVTGEEAIFKTGLLKWALGDLARLSLSARITATATDETMKIGGSATIRKSLARFVHTMKDGKKFRVTVVGVPQAGFELALTAETETVVNAEFKAEPHDNEGTLIIIKKEL